MSPQEPIRAQCALKERIALACKHASGERVHPQDAPAGAFAERPYGWRVNFGLFVHTKIKPCIATFAMLATLREGRPLPYVLFSFLPEQGAEAHLACAARHETMEKSARMVLLL